MKSFADWTTDLAQRHKEAGPANPTWEYWEAKDLVWNDPDDCPKARCQVCCEWTPVYCDPTEFDPTYHYCGGSPRCCP